MALVRCRGCCEDLPGSERMIEYEAKMSAFLRGSRCVAVCMYDRRRFDPAILLDVITTHPIVVLGAEFYHNFYYIPPAEFLTDDRPRATLR